jgi:SAM-dependent methyltransferase
MDAYKTKFENNYFDIIINRLGTKSHEEVFRILKRGGYYLVFVTGKDDWKEMVNLFGFEKLDDLEFHKKLVKEAGFKIVKIKKFSSFEYYKDLELLAKTLSIIPFEPPFSRKKHLIKLEQYVRRYMTHYGIRSTQKRIIIICKK